MLLPAACYKRKENCGKYPNLIPPKVVMCKNGRRKSVGVGNGEKKDKCKSKKLRFFFIYFFRFFYCFCLISNEAEIRWLGQKSLTHEN